MAEQQQLNERSRSSKLHRLNCTKVQEVDNSLTIETSVTKQKGSMEEEPHGKLSNKKRQEIKRSLEI